MPLTVRGYAASIISFTLATQTLPVRTAAEEITVFDASCLGQQMTICLGLLQSQTKVDTKGKSYEDTREPLQNTYSECVRAYQAFKSSNGQKNLEQYYKTLWPRGCGRPEMQKVRSVSDCADVGRANANCLAKVNVLSAADVQLARESFTTQLDAWLKMLENAGAVDLGQTTAATASVSTPPASAN